MMMMMLKKYKRRAAAMTPSAPYYPLLPVLLLPARNPLSRRIPKSYHRCASYVPPRGP